MVFKLRVLLCVVFLVLFSLGSFAVDPSFNYNINDPVNLKVPCINNNTYCSPSASCNITIVAPNTTVIVPNAQMSSIGNGYYNYSIPKSSVVDVGEYPSSMVCVDNGENGYSIFSVFITNEGINFTHTLPLIVGIGIIIFFLLALSMTLDKEHMLLRVLFIMISLFMIPLIPKAMMWGNITLTTFYNTTIWIVRIFWAYILVYLFWVVWLRDKIMELPLMKNRRGKE